MSGFSSDWLALREDADRRARNRDLAAALQGWFALREHISVVDLGCGTGANLRATAPLLPAQQSWRLIDKDAALITAARARLVNWADDADVEADGSLCLKKDGLRITVTFEARDLAADYAEILAAPVDLVTASALFDLVSETFIRAFVKALAARRSALYAVLTYNGLQRWSPHRPADNRIAGAFNRHQMTDKGFGPAAGPQAADCLAGQLSLEGYSVVEGDSSWRLDASDRMLIDEIQRGHALAVLELGEPDAKTVETWVKMIRTGAEIGHTDIFAHPGHAMPGDD